MNDLAVPQELEEEYYQINLDILQSFNKFRPPLNIYRFREDVSRVLPYYKVGERLSKEQTEELANYVAEGVIFVSRDDHPVYVKHISYQLDLVLLDKHLKESEIADIFQMALTRRMEAFFDQPVKMVLDKVLEDIYTLTEYIWQDFARAKALAKRRHRKHTMANHAVNCGFFGVVPYLVTLPSDFNQDSKNRQTFDRTVLGFFLHDLGMTKVPPFIRDKDKPLTGEDWQKLRGHTLSGYEMLARMDLKWQEVERAVMEHHERLDGSGYPQKRSGSDLTPLGLLVAAVDSFCAMTTDRPHAQAKSPMAAAKELAEDAKRYAPNVTREILNFVVNEKL